MPPCGEPDSCGDVTAAEDGAAGDQGGKIRTQNTIALSDAIGRYQDTYRSDFAVSYAATALHGFAEDTRNGYGDALQRLAVMVRRQPGASVRECLQDHMLGIVRTNESDSGLRRVLAGVRVLEKFCWIQPLVCPMD